MASAFINRGKSADLVGSDSDSPDYTFSAVLDERGRIIVPAFLRKRLSLDFGSKVLVCVKAVQSSDSKVLNKNKKRGEKYER